MLVCKLSRRISGLILVLRLVNRLKIEDRNSCLDSGAASNELDRQKLVLCKEIERQGLGEIGVDSIT